MCSIAARSSGASGRLFPQPASCVTANLVLSVSHLKPYSLSLIMKRLKRFYKKIIHHSDLSHSGPVKAKTSDPSVPVVPQVQLEHSRPPHAPVAWETLPSNSMLLLPHSQLHTEADTNREPIYQRQTLRKSLLLTKFQQINQKSVSIKTRAILPYIIPLWEKPSM